MRATTRSIVAPEVGEVERKAATDSLVVAGGDVRRNVNRLPRRTHGRFLDDNRRPGDSRPLLARLQVVAINVLSQLLAGRQPCGVIKLPVDAAVDAAHPRFLRGRPNALEP